MTWATFLCSKVVDAQRYNEMGPFEFQWFLLLSEIFVVFYDTKMVFYACIKLPISLKSSIPDNPKNRSFLFERELLWNFGPNHLLCHVGPKKVHWKYFFFLFLTELLRAVAKNLRAIRHMGYGLFCLIYIQLIVFKEVSQSIEQRCVSYGKIDRNPSEISTMDLIVCLQKNIIVPSEKTLCDLFLQKQNALFFFRLLRYIFAFDLCA